MSRPGPPLLPKTGLNTSGYITRHVPRHSPFHRPAGEKDILLFPVGAGKAKGGQHLHHCGGAQPQAPAEDVSPLLQKDFPCLHQLFHSGDQLRALFFLGLLSQFFQLQRGLLLPAQHLHQIAF